MNELSPPNLGITSFSLAPYNAGDQLLINPYTGKTKLYRRAPGSWQGTVRFGTSKFSSTDFINARRLLLRFHALLQGRNNIVKVRLPNDRQSLQDIPDGLNSAYVSSSAVGNEFQIVVDITNRGTYEPLAGDFFNVNDRLYIIHKLSKNNNRYTFSVFPEAEPSVMNPEIEFDDVFVKAIIDGTQPIQQEGKRLIGHTFTFQEAV